MTFTYTGRYEGHEVEGVVDLRTRVHTGDPHVVIQASALVRNAVRVGSGPVSATASWASPQAARATIEAVLDDGTLRTDLPEPLAIPEGATA